VTEKFNPYDLNDVAEMMDKFRQKKASAREARRVERERKIRRLESMGEGVNPYDIEQMADLFGSTPEDLV
jgi:hypothetical protein